IQAGEKRIGVLFDTILGAVRGRSGAAGTQGDGKSSDVVGQVTDFSSESGYGGLRQFLTRQYYALLHFPDKRIGWLREAVAAGRRLLSAWRADVIFASAPPVTAFVVAYRLSKELSIPWVADLRDLWVDNPYYSHPFWRKRLDEIAERRVLGSAAMLISVTQLWADTLRRKFQPPTP